MKAYYNIHTIWFVMMTLTMMSYVIGESGTGGIIVVIFLLVTAFIKGSFIINDFMELREVSFLWRAIMFGWLWGVCLSLAVIYFFST